MFEAKYEFFKTKIHTLFCGINENAEKCCSVTERNYWICPFFWLGSKISWLLPQPMPYPFSKFHSVVLCNCADRKSNKRRWKHKILGRGYNTKKEFAGRCIRLCRKFQSTECFSQGKTERDEGGYQLLECGGSDMTGNWPKSSWTNSAHTTLCLHSGASQASEDDRHLCMKCMDLNSCLDAFVKVLISVLLILTV